VLSKDVRKQNHIDKWSLYARFIWYNAKDCNGFDGTLNEYLVSIIDHFSRFIELYPVPDLSAKIFATCLLASDSNLDWH